MMSSGIFVVVVVVVVVVFAVVVALFLFQRPIDPHFRRNRWKRIVIPRHPQCGLEMTGGIAEGPTGGRERSITRILRFQVGQSWSMRVCDSVAGSLLSFRLRVVTTGLPNWFIWEFPIVRNFNLCPQNRFSECPFRWLCSLYENIEWFQSKGIILRRKGKRRRNDLLTFGTSFRVTHFSFLFYIIRVTPGLLNMQWRARCNLAASLFYGSDLMLWMVWISNEAPRQRVEPEKAGESSTGVAGDLSVAVC